MELVFSGCALAGSDVVKMKVSLSGGGGFKGWVDVAGGVLDGNGRRRVVDAAAGRDLAGSCRKVLWS